MIVVLLLLIVTFNEVTPQVTCNGVCADTSTCCDSRIGFYTCCPYQNGTCCIDLVSCCPEGYTCTSTHTCTPKVQDLRVDISSSVQLPVVIRRPLLRSEMMSAASTSFSKGQTHMRISEDKVGDMATILIKGEKTSNVLKTKLSYLKSFMTKEIKHIPTVKDDSEYTRVRVGTQLKYQALKNPEADISSKQNQRSSDTDSKVAGLVTTKEYFAPSKSSVYADNSVNLPDDDVICGMAVCVFNYTCCDWDAGPGCCQYTNGVCCRGNYCCPQGFVCDHVDTIFLCKIPRSIGFTDTRNKHQDSRKRNWSKHGVSKLLEGHSLNKSNVIFSKFLQKMFHEV